MMLRSEKILLEEGGLDFYDDYELDGRARDIILTAMHRYAVEIEREVENKYIGQWKSNSKKLKI